ncbi:ATP-binding protein [Microvirga sp. TS319]|uniref:ATP-binding protein n=1 Tax=Microvirga sp. TS319 TaxID=3241165 RepID=UPI00351A97E6
MTDWSGQYVQVLLSDTGTGMDKATMERVFEPFFTTKEAGKGTGLGLSQVYGFVRQSNGHVRIYSELGEGTTIKIDLPRLTGAEDRPVEMPVNRPKMVRGSGETILVVEDGSALRAYAVEALRDLGYRVLEAADGKEALAAVDQHPEIALLFTDVVLTGGVNGRVLADEVTRRKPGLPVLYTTGYTANAIVHHGRLDPGTNLIGKPFTYAELATKVRRMLDEGSSLSIQREVQTIPRPWPSGNGRLEHRADPAGRASEKWIRYSLTRPFGSARTMLSFKEEASDTGSANPLPVSDAVGRSIAADHSAASSFDRATAEARACANSSSA